MVWGVRGAQSLRTVWFGDREAAKPYAQYGFATQRRLNLTPNMVWRSGGAETLRTAWFGDPEVLQIYAE